MAPMSIYKQFFGAAVMGNIRSNEITKLLSTFVVMNLNPLMQNVPKWSDTL